ncbi:MAG: hypothetical protein NZM37_07620 [Sandaracinaceae bacterium]|nr:hypothetical protein [Sandaracinaceae bacterium]MDW8247028.1 hypothetical protein [Sandaracinaceae bacterium]
MPSERRPSLVQERSGKMEVKAKDFGSFHPILIQACIAFTGLALGVALEGCIVVTTLDECNTDVDCPGGAQCALVKGRRICTRVGCRSHAECNIGGRSGLCVSYDGGLTFQCVAQTTTAPYFPCTSDAECPLGTSCLRITEDGHRMCTSLCSSTGGSRDCFFDVNGLEPRCMSFDGGRTFSCWQACDPALGGIECPPSYGCFERDRTGRTFPPICLPRR